MKENFVEKLFKSKIIIGATGCIIVVAVVLSVLLLYKVFYNNNIKSVQTVSDIKTNTDASIKILVEANDDKNDEETQENNGENPEEQQEKVTEEQKKQEENKEKKVEEVKKNNNNSNYRYYLKVNYTANTVTAYGLDDSGNYTVPVRAMICSTGSATPTSGVYKTLNKYRWKLLIGNSYGQYSTRITGQILFHSVPYEKQSEDSIITKYYDRLGITTSLGCIRLTVIDAKWIYDNCPLGTQVEFYASSNPGPLGKPSATKITDFGYPLNKWDPTDPNPNNPWKNNANNNKTNNTTQNTTNDVTSNTTQNTTNNVTSNTTQNTTNDVTSNTTQNTTNDVISNTTQNTTNNVTNNTTQNTTNNVTNNTTQNTTNNVTNNTTNNTTQNITNNTTNNVTNNTTQNTTSNITDTTK